MNAYVKMAMASAVATPDLSEIDFDQAEALLKTCQPAK